ncbi:malto-oligosyltrehalose synthase [Microbacterium sp. 4R-513]|uniref:malto-oligosyltrehalose synthase n=1 Tax=Microbacterium sp. 4R-513 TaxID=2567934 RepID=UPI0013E1B8EA|nr:malto-oligosyltrehalose synthase [Microbacterium sp. 4R-513]QIG40479.1 malto-oligosyltrehalose synthase [Microbacterium sp. 4R-513]
MHPSSTYRLQIRKAFDLDAAAEVTSYLRDLGVGWAYLSPLLEATEGSDHGYDVVDPTRVDPARGGPEGLDRFVRAAREAGLGILVDIVPNHMGISDPAANPWWWDVLLRGRDSRYAEAFDIDWEYGDGRVRVPILGSDIDEVLEAGELTADPQPGPKTPHGALRYFDHVLPLAEGTTPDGPTTDASALRGILSRQHWELTFWRREAAELNYRRFFAVTTLAGVRVEVPWVFDETHAEILRWVHEGLVDGLRVDHPDGLRDPGGYLDRLAEATDGTYVLVEKILEHSGTDHPEALPAWWETDGTTGYDAMAEIDRVLIDPAGEQALDDLDARLRAESGLTPPVPYADVIHGTKRMIADTIQQSEIRRLVRCLPEPVERADDALGELLACFPVYRSYLPAGRENLDAAAAEASTRRPDLADAIDRLVALLADPSLEVAQRFQQTTGPVMAKGVEDTAFYRQTRLGTLTEVGGDPGVFSLSTDGLHRAFAGRQAGWPRSMTSLSTHDTKRGEDVRARLSVLSEVPDRWSEALGRLRGIASTGHGPFDSLLWQAIVGAWPATPERLHAYAEKAAREAAEATGWWDPDPTFEERMHDLVDAAFGRAVGMVNDLVREIRPFGWSNSLSAKLLQLAGPGVPDVYQGSELWETSLVDPDNRRAVDFAARQAMLAELDAGVPLGELPPVDKTGAAKLLVTSRALRLRRDRPDLFTRYTPMTVVGEASAHAIAYDRGGAVAIATRLPVGLDRREGWGDTALLRHSGPTVDVITGRRFEASVVPLAELLSHYPVALLALEEES